MITLVVRKTIRATPERLFDAWTQPTQLRQWWRPDDAECADAQVDLRVGGQYRIANRFRDGRVVWITGQFEVIEPLQARVHMARGATNGMGTRLRSLRAVSRRHRCGGHSRADRR